MSNKDLFYEKSVEKNCCAFCMRGDIHKIMPVITHKKGQFKICPNCISIRLQMPSLGFIEFLEESDTLKDDIHHTKGAIRYQDGDEEYSLKKKTLVRLLGHNLTAAQWRILSKKNEGKFAYMLHDDFYTEEGKAVQPVKYY